MRQIPIELRHYPQRMPEPSVSQEMYQHVEQVNPYQDHSALLPPPPPPQAESQMHQAMMPNQNEQRAQAESQNNDRIAEIRNILEEVPEELKNIIKHITGASFMPVPEGARREVSWHFLSYVFVIWFIFEKCF